MDREDDLDCFEFYYNPILDQQVDTIAIIDRKIFVSNRDRDLLTNAKSQLFQLVDKASFVGALKETRPDDRVDLYRRADNCSTDVVLSHPPRPLRNLRALCVKAFFMLA